MRAKTGSQPSLPEQQLADLQFGGKSRLEAELKRREPAISRYMEIAARFALNVQKGQEVTIVAERPHAALVHKITAACYKLGAKLVHVDYNDPMLKKLRAEHTKEPGDLGYVPAWIKARANSWVTSKVARIYLDGDEDPDLLSSCDPGRLAAINKGSGNAHKRYKEEVINRDKAQWSVLALPTTKWAEKVFPGVSSERAFIKLWDAILSACRADSPDWESRWLEHDRKLHQRCDLLNSLGLSALRFTGPGTDLTVGLTKRAVFLGGSDTTPEGVRFFANMPTEEVFTTPDCRRTEGKVRTTRPFELNGVIVEGLELTFSKGEIAGIKAKRGEEFFRKEIAQDGGAKRLGEVALVPTDSPIYRSGLLFQNTLFDENAACHIAIGSSYTKCIKGGEKLTKRELAALGANDSIVHTDMMISSDEVSVTGVARNGRQIPILRNGVWVA